MAGLAQWFHAEVPARPLHRLLAPPPMGPRQRILVATGGANPQARVQIGTGKLAGSEIHLALAGTCVEARLLTANEASRQTLIAAMDAVFENLRMRGLVLEAAPAGGVRDRRDQNDGRRQREWKRGSWSQRG